MRDQKERGEKALFLLFFLLLFLEKLWKWLRFFDDVSFDPSSSFLSSSGSGHVVPLYKVSNCWVDYSLGSSAHYIHLLPWS